MRQFIRVLSHMGVTDSEIDIMARRNPARLLDL
jgi:predicted metal-dependent phosphotriesterase family hydrolase